MAFNPDVLTAEHVLRAVELIKKDKIKLQQSTGYNVVINGKYYPPKEIIRHSYKIATGEDVGIIHGGEQVNAPLRALGFEVIPKAGIWKLGCNWGPGAPSFYEPIKARRIIIGHKDYPFKKGDLVLITEGFTVYAIAKLKEEPISIRSAPELEAFCKEFMVPYINEVFYAYADWYILPKTEVFDYQLRQGIRQVQNKAIKEKAIDCWENRNADQQRLHFYKRTGRKGTLDYQYPCIVFAFQRIYDGPFHTCYEAVLFKNPKEKVNLGAVKFLQQGTQKTILPDEFDYLDSSFCSLGQSMNYYKDIRTEFPGNYERVLGWLNDCAFSEESRSAFEYHPGYAASLLRTSEAELVLSQAQFILRGSSVSQQHDFTFQYHLASASSPHVVHFSFNMQPNLPNRFMCVVGKNATGKTQTINQLAKKLYDDNASGSFDPVRPAFSKIVAITFSYFDHFTPPERQYKNYEFIGINSHNATLSKKELVDTIWNAFRSLSASKSKKEWWITAIKSCMEQEYLNFELDALLAITRKEDFIALTYEIFSSGQKIVFQLITRLIDIIEDNSLIIFDEPETHLHPNIAGRLIRTLKRILEKSFSFCILATHSPVIVQEIPSMFIRIFDRRSNIPLIFSPPIECLGENLSHISNAIFATDKEKELYKQELERLVRKGLSLEDINGLFDNKLSLNAQLYVQTLIPTTNA